MSLQPVDEARCVARPAGIRFYAEGEYDAYAAEQLRLHEAEGERQTRPHLQIAAQTEAAATSTRRAIELLEARIKTAERDFVDTCRALSPFVRRPSHEKGRYWWTNVALLGGDVAAVTGAALWLGEVPALAVTQAVATGTAAITAGLLGREVGDNRRARRRKDARKLPSDLRRYGHFFAGGDSGESLVRVMTSFSLTLGVLIACSVAALRWGTEGVLSGIVFGGLALGIALASFINNYSYADEVADFIDRADRSLQRDRQRIRRFAGSRALRRHERANAAVQSIRAEADKRGQAAALSVLARRNKELALHPGVAGHGWREASDPSVAAGANGNEAGDA